MPYLSTSQEYLEQSALLLEAYPDTTRITTKYTYPTSKKSQSTAKLKPPTTATPTPSATLDPTSAPTSLAPATLTLKTFHPTSGICLKYHTNKAAEIGRLIAGLGKLASGAPVIETVETTKADEEMVDAPAYVPVAGDARASTSSGGKGGSAGGASAGGGGKKKQAKRKK
ncbi:hypothetical protein PAAG_02498 [Paracoccidioides lutzii Pb01]|uniref:SRP9 domain-containing protein n=1 Tax=Paracoccidioides lutzii (strain ATCC MYA-826 / Pb01) TaxID=502779 RepID=C1GV25_PARBA|nr:hypothetical protein PAAG_02498 [Paracoccidioides lutzii Pb01]EEH40443.1 hypothetical protein PAAG_02498 [Paracoccidioides lutzii Pb01]